MTSKRHDKVKGEKFFSFLSKLTCCYHKMNISDGIVKMRDIDESPKNTDLKIMVNDVEVKLKRDEEETDSKPVNILNDLPLEIPTTAKAVSIPAELSDPEDRQNHKVILKSEGFVDVPQSETDISNKRTPETSMIILNDIDEGNDGDDEYSVRLDDDIVLIDKTSQ